MNTPDLSINKHAIRYIHIRKPVFHMYSGSSPVLVGVSNLGGATIAYSENALQYVPVKVHNKDNYNYATGRTYTSNILVGLSSGVTYSVAAVDDEPVGITVMKSYLSQIDTRKCLAVFNRSLVLIDELIATNESLKIIASLD